MKGENAWLSMRAPAFGAPFELSDGRIVQEVGETIQRWPVNGAVAGLVVHLPENGWSSARRDQWLTALKMVLDLTIPVTDEGPPGR